MLYRSKFNTRKYLVVIIEPITEKEEQDIDNYGQRHGEIRYVNKDKVIIPAKDIYLYGEVDFNNEEDLNHIEKFNLIDDDPDAYNAVYSNFDFDKGICTTINGVIKTYPTWNALTWFMCKYVLIGKPKRIIVYKKYIKK